MTSLVSKVGLSLDVYIFYVSDFNKLDSEINHLRKTLKPKVNKLRDLEMKDDIKGFNLNPLSKEELRGIEGYCD